ncbi:MAG: CHAT domain-containing protein [Chitinophagaceae bacterium]
MKMNKLIVRGEKQVNLTTADPAAALTLSETYVISNATRGADTEKHVVTLDKDQVVEFVFEDNTVWMSSDETIQDLFPEAAAVKKRDATDGFEIPSTMQLPSETRGVVADVALKLLHVFTKKAVQKSVKALAADLEKKQLDNKSGLYRLDPSFNFQTDIASNSNKPFLLFLHGTASSTSSSFGEMMGTDLWKYIVQNYGPNVLAFQHETLTKSPLKNVAELISQLPANAALHIISHSRGGLVGDILSRFCIDNENNAGFSTDEVNYLKKMNRQDDIKNIDAINTAIKNKNIIVQKFVRVACPANGTTLASERMDHFFNISFNLIGLATGAVTNPIYIAFKNLLTAVIDAKDDVDVLPGLEAMNPDSAFIKVLNYPRPQASIDSPLMVVAGNSKLSLSFKALAIIAGKLFFSADNDLVVNTASMYNGTKRLKTVQYFFDEGGTVDHFHYFKNPKTNAAILLALQSAAETIVPGFSKLEQGAAIADRNVLLNLDGGQVFKNTVTGKRPIVVMVPGIMGSNLAKNGKLIWINYLRFLGGDLAGLKMSEAGIDAPSIMRSSYKKLADYLGGTYDVVTFAFDWRQQLNDSAKLFNTKINELLAYGQPIKIIGHSMGGVLVRDFIIHNTDTWQKLNASPGFRLLFLGSPLGGSFRIPYVLFGKDPIIDKLSKIDLLHSKKELLDVFGGFPGLLSLLPLSTDAANDFANENTWQKMLAGCGDASLLDVKKTIKPLLKAFGAYRDFINDNAASIDYSNAVYIAGRDKATPCGYELDDNNSLSFLSTAAGDSSVTWDSGIPKKMIDGNTVYYSETSHGALANDESIFTAISEIIANGSTLLLKKTRPSIRGEQLIFRTPKVNDFDFSAEGVENTLLGIGEEKKTIPGSSALKVSISNGDLKYASYPLVAGHFMNDGILYAEKAIDYNMHGALNERYQLGLYPGEIGSSEVIVTHQSDFNGAIIVGLGDPGRLTAYQLTQSVEQGVAKYLLNINSKAPYTQNSINMERIGISALPIACAYGGLSVEKSIRAIIMGVQNANNKIRQLLLDRAKTATTIEFIEQYQDRALNILYVLNEIEKEEDQTLNIVFEKKRLKKLLGSRERLPIDSSDEWWTRINVQQKEYNIKNSALKGLQFNISTGGAREEQRDLLTGREMIQELVNEMSGDNRWSPKLAKTIFELLVPNDFKEQLKKQSNINWIVDKDTASYPWELLQDSTNNAKPLCINAGMVRQLATQDYRVKINLASKNTALVIGDPDLKGFVTQLPGALQEGEMVADVLKANDYDTTKILRGSASDIIQAMFSGEYKIIHLAGHGMFDDDPSKQSGMVIGNNVFLSTREISQMSVVPELVFVNCCYLGKTDGAAETLFRNRFKLAANIGTQLIENGVKVVIAAGWAVDDAAALDFTKEFYKNMFEGDEFGQAVQQARRVIFDKYGKSNTWGAYQCYGDQFYTLTKGFARRKQKEYVIAKEAEIDLANLLNKLEVAGYTVEGLVAELNGISTGVDKADIRNGAITEKEAMIFAGLCMYKEAVQKYESLLKMENASFSFAAMEQYCNIRPKYYVSEFLKLTKNRPVFLKDMDTVLNDLNILIKYSPTSERLNLLASAYKRKAILNSLKSQKISAYKDAAAYYAKSYATKKNAYALANWFELEYVLMMAGDKRKWGQTIKHAHYSYALPSLKDAVKEIETSLDALKTAAAEMNYWDLVSAGNLPLCLLMLNYKSGDEMPPKYETVFSIYQDIWNRAGSLGQKKGSIEHWLFLIDALTTSKKPAAKAIQKIITQLKTQLEKTI